MIGRQTGDKRRSGLVARACLLVMLSSSLAFGAFGVHGEWVRSSQLGAEDFLSSVITAVEQDKVGRVWVGTDRGLAWTSDSGRTWNVVNLAGARPYTWPRKGGPRGTGAAKLLSERELVRRNSITALARGRSGLWVGTLNGLCLFNEDLRAWYFFDSDEGAPGPEIWSVAPSGREVWAATSDGLHRSLDAGKQWERVPGNFPAQIRSIRLIGHGRGRTCWLAGFETPPRYGGGPAMIYSKDGGNTWTAASPGTTSRIACRAAARVHRIVPIGRDLWACTRHGLARTAFEAEDWKPLPRRSGLTGTEVFDITEMGDRLWAGTREGLFYSSDNGETWTHGKTLRCPVTRVLAAGRYLWLATRGGLLRRTVGGDWRTFSVRSNVLAIAKITEYGSETWWVGTSGGLAFSRDAGRTWRSLTVSDGLPSNLILALAGDGERIWAATDGGVWTGVEGGQSWRTYGPEQGLRGLHVRDIQVADHVVYAATNAGLSVLQPRTHEWRTYLRTSEWHRVCVVDGLVFGVVVDPLDRAAGMSLIRGDTEKEDWKTLVLPGGTSADIYQILAVGDAIWVARADGLFRSRDKGQTWARFGSESLWSQRVTRLARGEGGLLCVETVPTDPRSANRTTLLNFTRNAGRTWRVLASAVPGHANAILVLKGRLIIGTRHGLSVYAGFERDLRGAHAGWFTWQRIAGLAASTSRLDRLGQVSAVDRYAFHGPTLWLGSAGAGVIERGVPVLDGLSPAWNRTGERPISISGVSKLDGEDILAMADSPEGMWFGTARGLFFHDRLASWGFAGPVSGPSGSTPVRAIATRGDDIWVGTDNGLYVLHRPKMQWRHFQAEPVHQVRDRTWHKAPLLPDKHVTALACDGQEIWGGTRHGGFVVDAKDRWMGVLSEERISAIALGSARAYFGTDRGVFALDRVNIGVTRRHLHKDNTPLHDNHIRAVFVDGPEVWAATPKGVRKILYDRAEPPASLATEPSLRGPEGVLVIVNDLSEDSRSIGEAYRKLRNIPGENICRVNSPTEETISRKVYQRQIRDRIWRYLREQNLSHRISFLVTTRGVPLRIAGMGGAGQTANRREEASVDSELTLLAREHPHRGPLWNPYLHREEPFDSTRFGMYLVTRLDGPTFMSAVALTRRAVTIEAERSFGARGFARFDMNPQEGETAERFDEAILSNYRFLHRQGRMQGRVLPPERTRLPYFRPESGANTFFYLGWGARKYRTEVLSWVQGGVGVCLDPLTAPSLRDKSDSWLAAAIDDRITATIGSVYDPGPGDYLSVANLYRYLHEGFTWAESAYMCIPHLSWQMVVIGDPLYTPLR